MGRIPTPVLEECVKIIRQRATKREEILLRALLGGCNIVRALPGYATANPGEGIKQS